jgi:hypothetical protein
VPTLDEALQELAAKLGATLSLVVAWASDDGLEAGNVRMSEAASGQLRDLALGFAQDLQDSEIVTYTGDAELEGDEVFLITDEAVLAELEPILALGQDAVAHADVEANQLDDRIRLYGVAAGDNDRIFLVRRSDPRIGYTPGRPFLAVFEERLEALGEPTFAFYSSFDFILAPEWVLVTNQTAFERLFREAAVVEAHVQLWVDSITEHLPMSDQSIQVLHDVARSDPRLWRRLREIHRRGHLAGVPIDRVEEYAEAMGLDTGKLIDDGELVFDASDRFSIIHLLNEDLFRGALTDEVFESQRKTPG